MSWPGQPGYPVGYAAAPGYPGSLTPHSGPLVSGTPANPQVYRYLDFADGVSIVGLHDVKLIGCRVQSNDVDFAAVYAQGSLRCVLNYCSIVPRVSFYQSPPGAAWPSANVGVNSTQFVTDVNCVDGNKGYQFGVYCDDFTSDLNIANCDIWGFGNAIRLLNSTGAINISHCWIHDAANDQPQGYHTDGPGYLDGGAPPQNVIVQWCTIASLGNTNGIAWQASTSPYANINMHDNYLSGFGYTAALFKPGSGGANGCTFLNNTFASDIQALFGPIYPGGEALWGVGLNQWSGNKFRYYAGTHPAAGAWQFTSADDGKFIWPDATLHMTDFS